MLKRETIHFSILAKFILSLSKDEFCGPMTETRSKSPFDRLRVISR
jgi:hypothetical protein